MEPKHRTAIHPSLSYLAGGVIVIWLAVIMRSFDRLVVFQNLSAIFLSLLIEGVPFILLGSFVASLVQEFVSPAAIARTGARLGRASIPVAALSGLVVPICECAIVPAMRRLREKGLGLAESATFLVAVPLINPIVIASTVVAFPGRPALILARFLGGFLVILLVAGAFALLERRRGKGRSGKHSGASEATIAIDVEKLRPRVTLATRLRGAVEHTAIEFVEVIGYFSVGAMLSAIVQVFVPISSFFVFARAPFVAILAMIALAFILSVCSEADAFIGKSLLGAVPEAAVLAFLVFGPMFDLKNLLLLRRVLSRREITLLATVLLLAVAALGGIYGAFLG